MKSERRRLTAEQYDEVFGDAHGYVIEFDEGEMLLGGRPFFEVAMRYLELLGFEVRPARDEIDG